MAIGDESSSISTVSSIGTSKDVQSFNSVHDNPNLKITLQLLDGLNYVRWAQSVKLFVGGRGKIRFFLGTKRELAESDPSTQTLGMYYARLRSSWEEISHYDSFIEWPASAPTEKVSIPPTAAEIYAKIVEKTRVFQFLAGLNPDFEYARVHLLDRTPFPTLTHIVSPIRVVGHLFFISFGSLQRLLLWLFVMLIRHHYQFLHKLHIHHHLVFLCYQRLPVTFAPRGRSVIIVVSGDI
ncbi:hypothetical protein GIB67_006443 [Kingdonia uniflora]|uniref:Retrotransposon Copia-like N-terminal domain-containing protein n=1 Tax=Kingdonia uniflora TaxID=39325 RepID=A0A7J7NEQ3_9MAGN|nr:hypothetical protein GIB67_006443 [Kingdonia uniflora]